MKLYHLYVVTENELPEGDSWVCGVTFDINEARRMRDTERMHLTERELKKREVIILDYEIGGDFASAQEAFASFDDIPVYPDADIVY